MNELIGVILTLANFVLIYLAYRFFGKEGLYAYIALSAIAVNIQVTKTVEILGFVTTLGNAMYTGIYLATDLINEKYGSKEAKKSVWMGFFIMLTFTVTMQLALYIQPHESDWAQPHLESLFSVLPALLTASFATFLISQQLDVAVFTWIKKRLPDRKYLWVRNNGSTLVSQLVDTLLFTTLMTAWFPWGIFPKEAFGDILLSTYIIKVLVTMLDTPFIYLMVNTKPKQWSKTSES
ncbi:MAG: queuosine precursor transporter [Bacilli bacterium]